MNSAGTSLAPETLVALAAQFMGQRQLPQLALLIVKMVQEQLGAEQVLLIRLHGDKQLRVAARAVDAPIDERMWRTSAAWVVAHCKPLMLRPRAEWPNDLPDMPIGNLRSLACVPLVAQNHVLGVLLLEQHVATGFPSAQIELFTVLASLAATALENALAYKRIEHSEARYQALLEHARDAVLLLSHDAMSVLEANKSAAALSGYARDDLLELAPSTLLEVLKRGLPDGATEFEAKLCTSDGREVLVSVGASKVRYDGEGYVLLIVRDISERGRLAQQLIQTEKLTGMSRLTASIAHEVNNPLQALQSSLNLLVERPMSDEKRAQILQMAREQVEQLVHVVQHMMDLYRPAHDHTRPVSLHEVLEGVLTMLEPRLDKHGIVVERRWEDHLPRVRGVSSQLKQVFGSLVLNAIDAMPQGGALTIRTQQVHTTNGKQVRIEVADTGSGINPHELRNIFEPFYTTRMERTGLSLAVSYSIIEQHEGTLAVESNNRGALFVVILPAL